MRFIPATLSGKRLRPGGAGTVTKGSRMLAWLTRRQAHNGQGLKLVPVADPGTTIVAHARVFLRVHENGGSNRGPLIDAWLARVGCPNPPSGKGWAWCAAFASCMLEQAGYPLRGGGSASCRVLRERAIAAGRWTSTPKPGYLGIVAGDEHVVIVISSHDGSVRDISGNTSSADGHNYNGGEVAEHAHALGVFSGFIRTY